MTVEVLPGLDENPSNDFAFRLVPGSRVKEILAGEGRVEGEDHAIPGFVQEPRLLKLPLYRRDLLGRPQLRLHFRLKITRPGGRGEQ